MLVAVSGALAMVFVDETAVGVALPSVRADLGMSVTLSHWVPNAYVLVFAGLAAAGGRVGDLLGHRRLFLAGVVWFGVASAACAAAPSAGLLVTARALQGVGAAAMMPQTMALLSRAFPGDALGRAMGVYISVASGFLIAGPLLGGLLTELAGWRAVFWVNPVLAAAVLVVARFAVPRAAIGIAGQRFDLRGAALLAVGLGALVAGIMEAGAHGLAAPPVVALLAGGLAGLAAFAAVEGRVPEPALDLSLMGRARFASPVLLLLAVQFTYIAVVVYGAVYLQDALGLGPLPAGLAMLPALVPTLVLGPLSGPAALHVGARRLLTMAGAGTTLGLGAIAAAVAAGGVGWFALALLIWGTAIPFVYGPANTLALGAAPSEQRGSAAGVLETAPQIGATLGLAVVGAIVVGSHGDVGPVGDEAFEAGFLVAAGVMTAATLSGAMTLARPA